MIAPATRIPSRQWRADAEARTGAGDRLLALYGTERRQLRGVWLTAAGGVEVTTTDAAGPVDSLVDVIPCAQWPEREAHDLLEIDFEGHMPLRPLVDHGSDWRVPVTGEGVHEVAVGPIHAGVIESGHFRFHCVGERILLLDLRLFYKHRGLERAAAGRDVAEAIDTVQRACGTCAVANSLAYALAAESIRGMMVPAGVARVRTLLLEMERLYNHLNDLSAVCAGVGFAAGSMAFAALKERAQRLNQMLFGHRFLFHAIRVGGSHVDVSPTDVSMATLEVEAICRGAASAWRETLFNSSVQDRLAGVGVLGQQAARRLGAVGPVARASGLGDDARSNSGELCYPGFHPVSPRRPAGDVAARTEVKVLEVEVTGRMINELLATGVKAGSCEPTGSPRSAQIGVGRIESARGETVCCLESTEDSVTRIHLRSASLRNWPALAEAVPGNLLPDFPLINKSFELCYACADR